MEKYKQILTENGIKPTYQRIKIMEYLEQCMIHPTADMIYSALYKKVPTLSKTTVYNTLDILRQHNLVNTISITESELHYEYRKQTHHHFLCNVCGEIYDVHVTCPILNMGEVDGHRIEQIDGYLKGVCNACLKKQ